MENATTYIIGFIALVVATYFIYPKIKNLIEKYTREDLINKSLQIDIGTLKEIKSAAEATGILLPSNGAQYSIRKISADHPLLSEEWQTQTSPPMSFVIDNRLYRTYGLFITDIQDNHVLKAVIFKMSIPQECHLFVNDDRSKKGLCLFSSPWHQSTKAQIILSHG